MCDDFDRLQAEQRRAEHLQSMADIEHHAAWLREVDAAERLRQEQLARPLACTCWDSDFGMDVDRCPIHGQGCA